MMPVNLNQILEWKKASADEVAMLNNLQGNILKGHGRHHTANLFLQFDKTRAADVKKFIRELAKRLTSAHQQLKDTEAYKKAKKAGKAPPASPTFMTLLLSAQGYRALGLTKLPSDPAFGAGLKTRSVSLNDPKVSDWEDAYEAEIHALLILADANEKLVSSVVKNIKASLPSAVQVVSIERGKALFNASGDGIEHFGYVDGRSQPLVLREDVDEEQQKKDGISVWNPEFPLKQVLVPCPGSPDGSGFGSYFVFRKLEQNVRGFKEAEEKLAEDLGLSGEDGERAGAMIVGRFEDGTPVVMQKAEGAHHPVPNNFNYADDRFKLPHPAGEGGNKCPFQGHIRKVNPRGDSAFFFGVSEDDERRHLIVRRGIPFGKRKRKDISKETFEEMPTGGVGLLFMCYQSSIEQQFEFVQSAWANGDGFVRGGTGIDPIIGQGSKLKQQWPVVWGGKDKKKEHFSGFVRMLGGEYFFAPCLSFLKGLA